MASAHARHEAAPDDAAASGPPEATHGELLALVALLSVGLVLRVNGLSTQSFWIDEVRGVLVPSGRDALFQIRDVFGPFDPPLGYLLISGARLLPLGLETASRIPSVLGGAAEIVFAYLLVRELTRDRRAALVAAALVAVAPFSVRYAQEARYYTVFSAMHLASWWACVRAIRVPVRRNLRWWTITVVLMLYLHAFAFVVLGVQMVMAFASLRRQKPSALAAFRRGAIASLLAFVPWFAFEAWHWIPVVARGEGLSFRPPGSPLPLPNAGLFRGLASWLLLDARPRWSVTLIGFVVLVLAAPVVAARRLRPTVLGMVGYALVFSVAVIGVARLVHTYFAYRRVEFLTPVLLMIVAVAVVGAADRAAGLVPRVRGRAGGPPTWVAAGAGALLPLLALMRADISSLASEKTNIRGAAWAVRDAAPDTVIVIGHFNQLEETAWDPLFRLYFDRLGIDRNVLSVRKIEREPLRPQGEVLWITGAPVDGPSFRSTPLNDLADLQTVAGDASLGGDFVIPLYLVHSRYNSLAELRAQAVIVAALPFTVPVP